MLVMQRKLDSSVMVGDGVEIRILKITDNSVKLGITAPRDIRVKRKEEGTQKNSVKTADSKVS